MGMKLPISDLTTDRQGRAAIGADQARVVKLLAVFTASYEALFGHAVAQRQAELEGPPSLQSEQEVLVFPLFSLQAGLTYDVLGGVSGREAANAKRNQALGRQVLEQAVRTAQGLPQRRLANAAEFAESSQHEEAVIFDGGEPRLQRAREIEAQKDHYSGKKSAPPSKP